MSRRVNVSVPRYRSNRLAPKLNRGDRVVDAISGFLAYEGDCVLTKDGYVDTKVHLPDYDLIENKVQ